jgi:hypothetical protein
MNTRPLTEPTSTRTSVPSSTAATPVKWVAAVQSGIGSEMVESAARQDDQRQVALGRDGGHRAHRPVAARDRQDVRVGRGREPGRVRTGAGADLCGPPSRDAPPLTG